MVESGARRPGGFLSRVTQRLIMAYQWLREGRPSPCRYVPSCSSYALEALEVHGFARGSWLGIRRVCRCHPWGSHGWDPVPPSRGGRAPADTDPTGEAN